VSFVHRHARLPATATPAMGSDATAEEKPVSADVQAVLTVLGRRSYSPAENYYLDLRKTYLRGADLQRADLLGADLHGANLREANLQRTNLHDKALHA
jgi:uncharacterized protein YjbI with pentapeptide repeats